MRDTQGDYDAAVAHHAEALDMQRAVYGAGACNAELANSRENLGNALFHRGDARDLPAAAAELRAALAMRSALASGQDYPLVRTLAKLGDVESRLGDVAAAAATYGRAKKILAVMPLRDPLVAHKRVKIDAALGALRGARRAAGG